MKTKQVFGTSFNGLLILSIAFLPLILNSCKKSSSDHAQTTTSDYAPMKFFGKSYKVRNYFNDKQVNENRSSDNKMQALGSSDDFAGIDFQTVEMADADFDNYVNDIASHVGLTVTAANSNFLILYMTDNSQKYEAIKGISTMTKRTTDVYLNHNFYRLNTNTLAENTSVRAYLSEFTMFDLTPLLSYSMTPDISANPTILVVERTPAAVTLPDNFQTRKLGTTFLTAGVIYKAINNSSGCSCGSTTDCGYAMEDDGMHEKCTGSCKVAVVSAGDPNHPVINTDADYDFRDNFLNKTVKGRAYIKNYYFINYVSNQLSDPESLSFQSKYDFVVACMKIANVLQYGNDNDIVIDAAFKSKADDMLSAYATVTDNSSYQLVLNNIKSDIASYQNLTRSQIINSLK